MFNCMPLGGNTTEGAERVVIKWYRVGTDEGVVWKNTSNSDCMKEGDKDGKDGGDKDEGQKSRRAAGKGKEMDDCMIAGTSTKEETTLLTGNMEAQMKYGVKMHPLGVFLSIEAAYSEVDSTYRCQAWKTNDTKGDAKDMDFTQPMLMGGLGVETGSTCAKTKETKALPLDNFKTTFSNNTQYEGALPGFDKFSVFFNNSAITPKVNKIDDLQVETMTTAVKDTFGNCQYYQVQRKGNGGSTTHAIVKTILVENTGSTDNNGSMQSEASVRVSEDNVNTTVVDCIIEGNNSIAEWVTMGCPEDTYTLAEASNSSTCGWKASITFKKSMMQEPCKAMCRSKSQCTGIRSVPFVAMPGTLLFLILSLDLVWIQSGFDHD